MVVLAPGHAHSPGPDPDLGHVALAGLAGNRGSPGKELMLLILLPLFKFNRETDLLFFKNSRKATFQHVFPPLPSCLVLKEGGCGVEEEP